MNDIQKLIKSARRIAALVPTSWAGETLTGLVDALESLNRENAALTFGMTTEWGVEYEISSEEVEYIPLEEDDARAAVKDSPTDTGLVRRVVSTWEPVSDE